MVESVMDFKGFDKNIAIDQEEVLRPKMVTVEIAGKKYEVRDGVWKAVFGDFKGVSEMFMDCVMCGLCVPVCIADIAPNLVALYASRAQGAFFTEKPKRLHERIDEIAQGQYQSEWDRILNMDEQQLKDVCAAIK